MEREARIFSNYLAHSPSHLTGQGKQSRARLLVLRACSPFPGSPPPLSPAATLQCTQDHPNRICKPPNEVDCKRQNDMRNVFFSPFWGGGSSGKQYMSGGGKVTGKGESRREVNTLWLHLILISLPLQRVAALHYWRWVVLQSLIYWPTYWSSPLQKEPASSEWNLRGDCAFTTCVSLGAHKHTM